MKPKKPVRHRLPSHRALPLSIRAALRDPPTCAERSTEVIRAFLLWAFAGLLPEA